jgi:hypothetical protein
MCVCVCVCVSEGGGEARTATTSASYSPRNANNCSAESIQSGECTEECK